MLTPESGRRSVAYGPIRVSPWSVTQLRRIFGGLRWRFDSDFWGDFTCVWGAKEWKGVALVARWRRRRVTHDDERVRSVVSREELMDRYREDWGNGEGCGEGWVAYGSALVRDGVLRDLRGSICRVLGDSSFPSEGVEAWGVRVGELQRNSVPWTGDAVSGVGWIGSPLLARV